MRVINARNVNDAWPQALDLLLLNPSAAVQASRAGRVRVWPEPVTTVYARPVERVLMDPHRNANVFFHLFEGLWMLAGRNDAAWLDQFVSDFSARFGEADGTEHDAYGHRWRRHFGYDQLDVCVGKLRKDSTDRQCCIAMWDSTIDDDGFGDWQKGADDLRGTWKTRPCNTHSYLRVQQGRVGGERCYGGDLIDVLDLTVCCRSNDAVWGAYGANCVHFSMLLEYLAARIGVGVGKMYQVSNNLHLYDSAMINVDLPTAEAGVSRPYPGTVPMVTVPEAFDEDLRIFMLHTELQHERTLIRGPDYKNPWFATVATPMFMANRRRRERDYARALDWAKHVAAPDWRAAALAWLGRRLAKKEAA